MLDHHKVLWKGDEKRAKAEVEARVPCALQAHKDMHENTHTEEVAFNGQDEEQRFETIYGDKEAEMCRWSWVPVAKRLFLAREGLRHAKQQ